MTSIATKRPARRGFTLVELIIVIAIIALLVGLLLSGVQVVRKKAAEVQVRNDISQLSTALGSCRTDLNLTYVPSYFVLKENNNYDLTDPAQKRTVTLLKQMFGSRINLQLITDPNPQPGTWPDWNGDGVFGGDTAYVLQGYQCLVFFLGGIPNPPGAGAPGCTGFSADPTNPTLPQTSPATQRKGPYFEFAPARLVRHNNNFFHYLDRYDKKQPYAYFSSARKGNDYNDTDCSDLSLYPYRDPSGRYINPSGFQIISAGRDGVFGNTGASPTAWDPAQGWQGNASVPKTWYDDVANFSSVTLRFPQN
jgi:general secretion pathway protein G